MTTTTTAGARLVETPGGVFRLSYSRGSQSNSRESHTETARRWGLMPDALQGITDISAEPVHPDGNRYAPDPDAPNGRDRLAEVTVNGVTYTGNLYYCARGYWIGTHRDAGGWLDNGWSIGGPGEDAATVDPDRCHYWTGQHLTRETARSYWQPITDAGLRKVTGWLAADVAGMLADRDALAAYWRRTFEECAGYAASDARRAVDTANAHLAIARRYGSAVPGYALTGGPDAGGQS